jgi:hypothetical protein
MGTRLERLASVAAERSRVGLEKKGKDGLARKLFRAPGASLAQRSAQD